MACYYNEGVINGIILQGALNWIKVYFQTRPIVEGTVIAGSLIGWAKIDAAVAPAMQPLRRLPLVMPRCFKGTEEVGG